MGKVKVIQETKTGSNILFQNVNNNNIMTRSEFVSRIENPNSVYHEDYYVKKQNRNKNSSFKA